MLGIRKNFKFIDKDNIKRVKQEQLFKIETKELLGQDYMATNKPNLYSAVVLSITADLYKIDGN